ncbi:MAG: hypothetical protein ACOCSQ_03860, partial [Planctomycetota bacterium]
DDDYERDSCVMTARSGESRLHRHRARWWLTTYLPNAYQRQHRCQRQRCQLMRLARRDHPSDWKC